MPAASASTTSVTTPPPTGSALLIPRGLLSIAAQIANLMRDLQERLGLTYLLISHDLRMVELVAHRVLVMYLGRVMEMAPARVLATAPAHPYSRLLWAAVDPYTGRRIEATPASRWELSEGDRPQAGCRFRDRCPVYHAQGEPGLCRDRETEPALTEISPGHLVPCHFPEGG